MTRIRDKGQSVLLCVTPDSGLHTYNARLVPYKRFRHYIYDAEYRVVSVLFPGWTGPDAYPRAASVRPRLQILLA
jgi:hypothetical protein